MELVRNNGPVTTVGGGSKSNFSIAMNAKAFRVLSDTLYQDKIGSIVREISCNGLDGHIMAGKTDKPITIHVPDQFEPWFTVRDYGVGLSPESVNTVFCVYFESTKDQSNDAVGAFGLGAKTPFAYTDQFNVVSIYNGRKYAYSAFINGEGIPEIQLMAETETDEENGVEIRIGVKPEDFQRFINAVAEQLRFFPVRPEIVNYTRNGGVFPWKETPEYMFESDSIKVFRNAGYGTKLHIVQGPVGYPLDFSQLISHLDSDQSAFLRMIQGIGANLYFNIGEIGVTASREGVEYNPHTITNLKAKLDKANKELVAWVEGQLKTLPTVYEKAKFINDNTVFRNIINGVTLDMAPATRHASGMYVFSIGTSEGFVEKRKRKLLDGKEMEYDARLVTIVKYTSNGNDGFRASRTASDDDILVPENSRRMAIVIRDTGKTPVARMRHYFKTNNLTHMYMLQAVDDDAKMDDKFIKALSKSLGGFSAIVKVSDMPEPPKAQYDRTRESYSLPTAYTSAPHGGMDLDSVHNWTRVYDKLPTIVEDEEIETAIYVTVERQRITDVDYSDKIQFLDLCRANLVDYPLYAIREKDVEKLADTGAKWISMSDYVKSRTAAIKADTGIRRFIVAELLKATTENMLGKRILGLEGLHPRTEVARLIRIHKRCEAILKKKAVNTYMQRLSGYNGADHVSLSIVRNRGESVYSKIPLMRHVLRSGYGTLQGEEAKHVVEYINHFGA